MKTESKSILFRLIEEAGVPAVAILSAVGLMVEIHEASEKLGWRVISIVASVTCAGWAGYVWTARRPNTIDPSQLVLRFPLRARIGAVVAMIIATVSTGVLCLNRYPYPRIPFLIIKVVNTSNNPANLNEYADTYFSVVSGPVTEDIVATGRLKLQSMTTNTSLMIPAHSELWIAGRFLNEKSLLPLMEREDVALSVLLRKKSGDPFVSPTEIPFARDIISRRFIEVDVNQPSEPPHGPVASEDQNTISRIKSDPSSKN